MVFLIKILLAHFIGDFFLQPAKWVKDKEERKIKSKYLYLHVLIHFALLLLFTWNGVPEDFLNYLPLVSIIAGSHFIVDVIKLYAQKEKNKRSWFFIDQALHLVILFAATQYAGFIFLSFSLLNNSYILSLALAFMLILKPASVVIKMLVAKWQPPRLGPTLTDPQLIREKESLQNAGEWIGMLERSLVLLFIVIGHWEAVGFLLAAKSVFRFGDIKAAREMKLTEYVLIGTLLSFGIAIVIAVLALQAMR